MILLSSCLAGFSVRYNGSNAQNKISAWLTSHGQAIVVCPEVMVGFEIPRASAEISNDYSNQVLSQGATVIEQSGHDVTTQFLTGANLVLDIAERNHVTVAFLKDKSPSCGVSKVYDGSFTGRLIDGTGVTAQTLINHGITVRPDTDLIPVNVVSYVDSALREIFMRDNS